MTNEDQLKAIRKRIDELDQQIQTLIAERAKCAQDVARVKGNGSDFYRPEREAEVLRKVAERNRGPLATEEMVRLFREIMSACLALEQPLKIAFLGPEGTFTQAAALKQFGHSVHTVPLPAIDAVFREVESGAANYGVVPVENSTEGVINHTLDMFINSPLKICGEVEQRIHHNLMSDVADVSDIRRVYSHSQSLAQCREWIEEHMSGVELVSVSSNAEAARRAKGEAGAAAIAGETAAQIYGLDILVRNIEDEPDNTTRFLVIGRNGIQPSGNDKTTLLLSTANRPGSLHELLAPLARHGVSMTRIESRPSRRGTWDYVFFVDIEGHAQAEPVATALRELEQQAAVLKVLGSYPRAVI
jgi:chorismate mutase/prephenate dehydratase